MQTLASFNLQRADFERIAEGERKKQDTPIWGWFSTINSKQWPIYMAGVTGFAQADVIEDGAEFGNQDRAKLPQLTLTAKQIGLSWKESFLSRQADPNRLILQNPKMAAKALAHKLERMAVDVVLNNAFSSGLHTIATGSATYADAHSVGGTTFDNLATGAALSESVLETMFIQLRKAKDAKNKVMPIMNNMILLVSPDNDFVANKIYNTTQKLGGNNNDTNEVRKLFRPVTTPHAVGSTTAFALLAADGEEATAYKQVLTAPQLMDPEVKAEGHRRYVYQMSGALNIQLPYFIIGNAGA